MLSEWKWIGHSNSRITCVTMTTHSSDSNAAQIVTVGDGTGDNTASVIAVENSSPEVIHVVSLANNSGVAGSLPSQIYSLPALSGTQILSQPNTPQVSTLSGLQTLTFNTANIAFPVSMPLQHMVSNVDVLSRAVCHSFLPLLAHPCCMIYLLSYMTM